MDDRTHTPEPDRGVRLLERYADRSRPPTPRVYAVTGVALGVAIALFGILPGAWGAMVVAVVAAIGVGYDRWLLRRHDIPSFRHLPASLRREQQALVAAAVVGLAPLLLTPVVTALELQAGAITSGIVVGLLLAIGGPIVDRRARASAADLLDDEPDHDPRRGRGTPGDRPGSGH